jgi:hypothetical protein
MSKKNQKIESTQLVLHLILSLDFYNWDLYKMCAAKVKFVTRLLHIFLNKTLIINPNFIYLRVEVS